MCRRALKIGLPALAFTEHLDLTGWAIDPEDLLDHLRPLVGDNGLLIPEPLDVAGYLESVERCRSFENTVSCGRRSRCFSPRWAGTRCLGGGHM